MKAIILAGGLGTRLRPLTDVTPKPLLPIRGTPIIEHAIINLRKYGIKDIILSVGYMAGTIKGYFGDGKRLGVNISYAVEEEPLGTGGAIRFAAKGINEPFIVLNGDNLADFDYSEALKTHKHNDARVTIGLYPVEDVTRFGIAQLDGQRIVRFIEKPSVQEAPSNLNNAGLYIMEPSVLEILPGGPCSIEKDCFEQLCGPEGRVFAYRHHGQWYPTDDMGKYCHADRNFQALSSSGVEHQQR
jgi:NDP-sugar pyrophosphorylase family protein